MELYLIFLFSAAVLSFQGPSAANAQLVLNQVHTTFRALGKSDQRPPATHLSGMPLGYKWIDKTNKCNSSSKYAGYRLVEDNYDGSEPSIVLLYDNNNQDGGSYYPVVGLQSIVPRNSFKGYDCLENEYYTVDTIDHIEYCVLTAYFKDPSLICGDKFVVDNQMYFQKGEGIHNLVKVPGTYAEAAASDSAWHTDKYFLGMGHHFTPRRHGSNDCVKDIAPFQAMYAYVDGHCHNTGFVFQHYNSDAHSKDRFEEPNSIATKAILSDPAQCVVDCASDGMMRTMHAFLGGSTTYCVTN